MDIGSQKRVIIVEKERVAPATPVTTRPKEDTSTESPRGAQRS